MDSVPPPPPPPSSNGVNGSGEGGSAVVAPNKKPRLTMEECIAKRKAQKQPLDMEEWLANKKAADALSAKPRYIPKKERERRAREQAEKEAAALKERQERSRDPMPVPSANPPSAPRAMRNGDAPKELRKPEPQPDDNPFGKSKEEMDMERTLIRQRYMGTDTNMSTFSAQKKRKRTTEKKFNFDWNPDDDTSQDYNPIYQNRIEYTNHGRRVHGGFADDPNDTHAKEYAKLIEARDPETGKQRAAEYLDMERRRREEAGRRGLDFKHWSEKKLENMKERDWRIFKEDFNISTKGGSIPNPMRSWKESGLPPRLLEIVDQAGYTEPTPVQRATIPIALQSRDLIGVAVTGSGKTAAFILPLLVYISALPTLTEETKNDGPYAIILAPTRELAQQIEVEAKKFATPLGFTCVSLVGGHSIESQSYNMRDGAEIIIATTGRLLDCLERRVLVLSQCCYVIMDEADRMIDMGFEDQVNKILDALPVTNEKPDTVDAEDSSAMAQHLGGRERYRQTMMYTATMPAAVERIARRYLRRPAQVAIGNAGEAVDTVEQRAEFVSGEERRRQRLAEILHSREFAAPIIVFVNTKSRCDGVARDIQKMGFSTATIHGSKAQDQREAALTSLRAGTVDILVATDVAGRGIDVPNVSLVVNFDMATSIERYTHRIGRTGRAGRSGVAVTFLGSEDNDVLYDLRQMISKSAVSRLPEELRRHEAAQQKGGRNAGRSKGEDSGGFGGRGGWA